MDAFLCARAQETVSRGLMLISGPCLLDGIPMARVYWGIVVGANGSCLINMAKSGLISEEKVESFNLPVYLPYISELKETIERNGSFSIEKFEKFANPMDDKLLSIEFLVSKFRAIFHGTIEDYFGKGMGDELFDNHYEEKLKEFYSKFKECDEDTHFFISLKRKDR